MALVITAIETWLRTQAEREEGQGLAEYGLILALVAVVAAVALTPLGQAIQNTLSSVAAAL